MARSSRQVSNVAAMVPRAILMIALCLFLATSMTHARRNPTLYMVGDEDGWGTLYPMDTWAEGKTFYAGDILEFKYDTYYSNMVVVNDTGYQTCIPNAGSQVYDSGYDKIYLPYGKSYYIGSLHPGSCQAGEKMTITALAP